MHKYYDICEGVLTASEILLDGDVEAELYTSFSLKEETKLMFRNKNKKM